MLVIL